MNRSDLRKDLRRVLRDFYDLDTVRTGGITSSAITLPVNNPNRYNVGDLLVVESEEMTVTAIDQANLNLTVVRAKNLSTAAAHVAGVAIKINPEWGDNALNQGINYAIDDMYPGVWIEVIDETLVTSSAREYTIPAGFAFFSRVQIEDANGNFHDVSYWEPVGTVIQFFKDFPETGKTIRLIGVGYQGRLSDDTTALDLADEQSSALVYLAANFCIQQRFAHRLKSTEYSAAVNDRAGQPFDLINMSNTLKKQAQDMKARETRPLPSGYAAISRR